MVKKRVHELAKELDIESKDIIRKLSEIGVSVKSHMSTLEDDHVDKVIKFFTPGAKVPGKDARPGQGESGSQNINNRRPAGENKQARPGAGQPGASDRPRHTGQGGQGGQGDRRRTDNRRDTYRNDRGPGLVDRVPSRPPDRRFEDRPGRAPAQGKQAQQPQGGKPQGAHESKPVQPVPEMRGDSTAAPKKEIIPQQHQEPDKIRPAAGHQPEHQQQAAAGDRPVNREHREQHQQFRPRGDQGQPAQGGKPRPQGGQQQYNRPQGGQQQYNRPQGGQQYNRPQGGQQQYNRPPRPPGEKPPYQGPPRQRQEDGRPGFKGREGQFGQTGGRPPGEHGGQGYRDDRPAGQRTSQRAPGQRPAGAGGGRPKPDQLKVPKVPEQAKGLDKVKASEKSRARVQQNQARTQAKGREKGRPLEELNDDRKLRPSAGKKRAPGRQAAKNEHRPAPVQEKKPVVIGETVTVQELAEKMKKSPAELIKRLLLLGVMATINQEIDADTAGILAAEFGFEIEVKVELDAEALLEQELEEDPEKDVLRPCVVTVMGHVDHGKTSLLDAIRETNVIATEAGGITQHIGAYQVEHNNKKITFVDTPGHEAFTAMRARGARVTDIAILVVAADDGVMPQTIEAINHAKAAEVPIIVAINKMDKLDANPDRVKQQLTEHGLVVEEWGGETISVPVSAKSRQGLEDLLEMILLVSEVAELKANPDRNARGTVIEAELDKGRGPVATVLVQNGTLRVGDNIMAGTAFGRVRAMMDDKGRRIKKAGPSTPVEVLGFHDVPLAGDLFYAVDDEKTARQIAEKRTVRKRQEELKTPAARVTLDDLFKHIQEGQVKELHLIVKADVQGSVEAVKQSLERLSTEEVKVNIIHGGVGAITETDIMLASASNAIIIGFNVRPDVNARKAAENEKVDIRLYRVIYDAIEDVKAAMTGLLDPELREVALGRVEVRKTFKVSKLGTIAGCYVTEGKIVRDAGVRLVRDGVVVYEGKLDSLKRFKDDAKEVAHGYECGLTLENFNDIHEGDIIEAFTTESVKRELA